MCFDIRYNAVIVNKNLTERYVYALWKLLIYCLYKNGDYDIN